MAVCARPAGQLGSNSCFFFCGEIGRKLVGKRKKMKLFFS